MGREKGQRDRAEGMSRGKRQREGGLRGKGV